MTEGKGHRTSGQAPQSAEVVSASDLRALIEKLIREHDAERISIKPEPRFKMEYTSGKQWIEQETGVPWRSIYRLIYESEWVTARKADQILTGLGLQHLYDSPQIRVVPNPTWDQERWQRYMDQRGCRR